MLHEADIALYRAKNLGRGVVVVFSAAPNQGTLARPGTPEGEFEGDAPASRRE